MSPYVRMTRMKAVRGYGVNLGWLDRFDEREQ
jgi:hypothetical protein